MFSNMVIKSDTSFDFTVISSKSTSGGQTMASFRRLTATSGCTTPAKLNQVFATTLMELRKFLLQGLLFINERIVWIPRVCIYPTAPKAGRFRCKGQELFPFLVLMCS